MILAFGQILQLIVQAFTFVFEELWLNSSDINTKLLQKIESPKTILINDKKEAQKEYKRALLNAKKEVIIATSANGLAILYEIIKELKEFSEAKRISVKIMASITGDNWEVAKQLSKYAEVKHSQISYITTIIDGKYLFQFKDISNKTNDSGILFYSDKTDTVNEHKTSLLNLWENALTPSGLSLENINRSITNINNLPKIKVDSKLVEKNIKKIYLSKLRNKRSTSKLTQVQKINWNQSQIPSEIDTLLSDVVRTYGINAQAVIRPPKYLNLPDILFQVYHIQNHSILKPEDVLVFHPWLDTPVGQAFMPAAVLTTNPDAEPFWKAAMGNTPGRNAIYCLKNNEFQVNINQNTLFAGWTVPIALTPKYVLPPCCLIVEGYGNIKSGGYSVTLPSGYNLDTTFTWTEAFVTFLHPSSKYSGPGIDGAFGKDVIMEFYPPKDKTRTRGDPSFLL